MSVEKVSFIYQSGTRILQVRIQNHVLYTLIILVIVAITVIDVQTDVFLCGLVTSIHQVTH